MAGNDRSCSPCIPGEATAVLLAALITGTDVKQHF